MSQPNYTYASIVEKSEQVAWKIDDLFPEGQAISFEQPHLPEVLAATHEISFLSEAERMALNHIRGHAYMNLFAFVEEYIIAQAVQHAQAEMFGDHEAVRALLRFGEEEIKHQKLFLRYCEAFRRDWGAEAGVLGSAAAVAGVILDNSPLAVLLVTLHLEIMTQQHYVGCVKDDGDLYPVFTNILKHHWIEEAQHAKIDVLEMDKLVEDATPEVIDTAVAQYFGILEAFDGLLGQQVDMDIESLSAKTGRKFTEEERLELRTKQHRSYRNDFLVMGMSNPMFVKHMERLSSAGAVKLVEKTAEYRA